MNCGKCQSPLTYGIPACAVCGTPVAWDQAPAPQPLQQPVRAQTIVQPQPSLTPPSQTIAQPASYTVTPSPGVVTPQPLQSVAQPTVVQAQSFQPSSTMQSMPQPAAQFMQPSPQPIAQNQPLDQSLKGPRATATGITAIVLGAVQLLISLAAFTDEEVAATSGAGITNAVIGAVFVALGIVLVRVSNSALLFKLTVGFAVLSVIIIGLSFAIGVAGYHYVIALGFAGFSLWKLFRVRKSGY